MSNASHIEVWNEVLLPKYLRFRAPLRAGFHAHGEATMAAAALQGGERVLDVGCGFGDTSVAIAERVGPAGRVIGLDPVPGFLAVGAAEAEARGLAHLGFVAEDAATARFPERFDVCFSRFGTMFFSNPVPAFRNLAAALVPGGRLAMTVWRALRDNPFVALAKQVAERHLPPPSDDAPTCGPGPFSLADPERLEAVLAAAGFVDVRLARFEHPVRLGGDLAEALALLFELGPAGERLRLAGAEGERARPIIAAELADILVRHRDPDGAIALGSSSWVVTARAG